MRGHLFAVLGGIPAVLGAIFASFGLVMQTPAEEGAGADAGLRAFLRDPAIRGARVGVVVADLATGESLVEHQPARALVPASNQKILITAAVLARWGPTHRFETPLLLGAAPDAEGVVDGALWIVGRGDPTLTSESMWKLAEEIRLRGIREIRGGIGVDVSYLDSIAIHPDWEPASSRAYHAPTGAFAVNYSAFRIEIAPGSKVGRPALLRVAPDVGYFRTRSDAVTVPRARRLQLEIERLADGSGERVHVSGAFPLAGDPDTFWRAVSMPTRYAASVLRAQLEAHGVRVAGSVRVGPPPPGARELLRFEGAPLGETIRRLNKWSNNFIAEQLIKVLGAERFGAPGTWDKGARALEAYLAESGIARRGGVIADASGLSARNRIAPTTLVEVLRSAALRFDSGPEFLASFPLGGLDGTLEDRMVERPVAVRGKTGHLRRVSTLTGVLPAGERRLAFAILVNGARGGRLDVDNAIDRFVSSLVEAADVPADQGAEGG